MKIIDRKTPKRLRIRRTHHQTLPHLVRFQPHQGMELKIRQSRLITFLLERTPFETFLR